MSPSVSKMDTEFWNDIRPSSMLSKCVQVSGRLPLVKIRRNVLSQNEVRSLLLKVEVLGFLQVPLFCSHNPSKAKSRSQEQKACLRVLLGLLTFECIDLKLFIFDL